MRKVVAAINMTLDGFCDHTAIIPDEEIHDHYTNLLKEGDAILYGRKTFELMQFWQELIKNPSGEESMDSFARAIDSIPKIVFSKTLKNMDWATSKLALRTLEEEVWDLKQQDGKNVFVGSRSLILQLLKLQLINELQICIHPVIVGNGLPLFESLNDRVMLNLINIKKFKSGAVIHYYAFA